MTETQRRIQELKAALPNVKEKVVAVAVLLAMSIAMMASVSYAWYTLSLAPELGGVTTTVSSNGSLEIALSDFDGKEPNSSAVGDSFSADGHTSSHTTNVTWGNLINLSAEYGLESLILRPAVLDDQSDVLLSGVKYGDDGRVEGAATDFGFTTWMLNTVTNKYYFGVPQKNAFGVRAISSVGYPDGKGELQIKLDKAEEDFREAHTAYSTIMATPSYINVIQNVVQVYLDANVDSFLNGGGEVNTDCTDYVADLTGILEDFYNNAICSYGDALAALANIQKDFQDKDGTIPDYTRTTLLAASTSQLNAHKIDLGNSLTIYKKLEASTRSDMVKMQGFESSIDDGARIYWKDLEPVINNLININTVTVEGKTASQIIALGASNIISYVMGLPGTCDIRIHDGNLKEFEKLTGNRMDVTISFKISFISKKGRLRTDLTATDVNKYSLDVAKTVELGGSAVNKGNMEAQDTYGMVLDLWFRTNAGNGDTGTILTLDGLPKINTYQEQRKIVLSGETESRPVYYYSRPTGQQMNGIDLTEEILVYKAPDVNDVNGNGSTTDEIYYDCTSYSPVYIAKVEQKTAQDGSTYNEVVNTTTLIADDDVQPKMDTFEEVIGFESSNRVWNDGEIVLDSTEMSATQGSGSCYVFYADTPEAYAAAVELLSHIKFAFMDANGTLLSEAEMDVEHIFAESGKYTVPIRISSMDYETTNEAGETVYGITSLEKNVAQRISVVVYLDGLGLENNMVMANDSITGTLNLQFSTMEDLRALGDSALEMDTISLRADIDKTSFTYTGTVQSAALTAYVEGLSPNKVEAMFQRKINASQGTQMTKVEMTNTGGSVWTANYPFTNPGTYVLNSLWIDGVEYNLPENEKITVVVTGFVVESVSFCDALGQNLALTADYSVSRDISISFDTTMDIKRVEVRLRKNEDNSYISTMLTKDSYGYWNGSVPFTSSGSYTLEYVVVYHDVKDAEGKTKEEFIYHQLEPNFQKTFTAYLGLKTKITLEREGGLTFILKEQFAYNRPVADSNGNITTQNVMVYQSEDVDDLDKDSEMILYYCSDDTPVYKVVEEDGVIKTTTELLKVTDEGVTPAGNKIEEAGVRLEILTDNDASLKGLENVKLYYTIRGSELLENGISADLTWNGKYYVGTLNVDKAGVFSFGQLNVGSEYITNAVSAPSITARDISPVMHLNTNAVYSDNKNSTPGLLVLTDSNNQAYVEVQLMNADTAEGLRIDLKDPSGKIHSIACDDEKTVNKDNVYSFYFLVPTTYTDGKPVNMHGEWKVEAIYMSGVYDSEGDYYGTDASDAVAEEYVILVEDDYDEEGNLTQDNNVYKFVVLKNFGVEISGGQTVQGGDFLSEQNIYQENGIKVVITPDGGFDLDGFGAKVSNVKLTLTLDYNANTYMDEFGYTYSSRPDSATKTFNLVQTDDGSWVLPTDATMTLAGRYNWSVSYDLVNEGGTSLTGNTGYTVSGTTDKNGTKVLTLYSEAPTVTVKDVTPGTNEVFYTSKYVGGSPVQVENISNYISEDRYYAVVYMSGTKSMGNWSYTMPSVTLKLEDVADGIVTSLEMVNAEDTSTTHVFSFVKNEAGEYEATQTVGKADAVIYDDTKYLAGKTTFTSIPVTYDEVTYTVMLSNPLTIEQPEAPYTMTFANIPDAVLEQYRPEAITINGSRLTITMPTYEYSVKTTTNPSYGEWSGYSNTNEVLRTDYTHYSQWAFLGTVHRYNYYNWTKFARSRTVTGSTSTQPTKVTTWTITIGDQTNTYVAGETYTIEVNGDVVAYPTHEAFGNASTTTETYYEYEYQYGYVASSTDQSNPSSGSQIGSAYGLGGSEPKPKLYANGYAYSEEAYQSAWP